MLGIGGKGGKGEFSNFFSGRMAAMAVGGGCGLCVMAGGLEAEAVILPCHQ